METVTADWEGSYTGFFNGKPCKVLEDVSISLLFGEMNTQEMVKSEEFQMLEKAGFEVARYWEDEYLRKEIQNWKSR